MAQYDRQIATALRLIKKYGQVVQWQSYINSTPDLSKPWIKATGALIENPTSIVFLPLDKQGLEYLASIGKTEAVSGSMYGLMGAVNFEPKITDTVLRSGVKLEISSIDLLAPNSRPILYTIIFKG